MFARTLVLLCALCAVGATVADPVFTDVPTPSPTTVPTDAPTTSPTDCPKCHVTVQSAWTTCSHSCGGGDTARTTRKETVVYPRDTWPSDGSCGLITNCQIDGVPRPEGINVIDQTCSSVGDVNWEEHCPVDCELEDAYGPWGHPTSVLDPQGIKNDVAGTVTTANDIWGNAKSGLQMERVKGIKVDPRYGGMDCPPLAERVQTKPWLDHCVSHLGEVHTVDCGGVACVNGKKTCIYTAQRCSATSYSRVKVVFRNHQVKCPVV